jgi:hypothetical protein
VESSHLQRAALVQVALTGVSLPASSRELLAYARRQAAEPDVLQDLERLPDREFSSLDEVGEELAPVQPRRGQPVPHSPKPESGAPPGGDAYERPASRAR